MKIVYKQMRESTDKNIKFGVWLSVNCDQDKSKDGWWLYEKTWLTTEEVVLLSKKL